MHGNKISGLRTLSLAAVVASIVFLSACTVAVQKGSNGQDKNVDIKSLVGDIHVSKNAAAADTGLAVYPGARLKPEASGHDEKSANVNISGFGFGLRVVALEYESDDSPERVVAFYKDQLKKYGYVLECRSSGHYNVKMRHSGNSGESHALTCDGDGGSGKNVELKVGIDENQHIVAVEPEGEGSSFSLVYVRAHGKEADI